MYKIAHISDLHICFKDDNKNGEKLVEILKEIESRKCDHVVITGDLVDNPVLKDNLYVKEILSHFNLMDKMKLSVVPGNHDVFGGAPSGINFFTFPSICENTNYKENVNNFIEVFRESFPENTSFPYLKNLDNLALIGINSVDKWSLDKNVEGSNGRINDDEYEQLKNILSSSEIKDKFKIILIHHYFSDLKNDEGYPKHNLWLKSVDWKMKLYGKKKLTDLFKKHKVNLVLHGHSHVNQIYNIKGVTYLNSSAAITPITDDHVRKYNIISIPDEKGNGESISIDTIII